MTVINIYCIRACREYKFIQLYMYVLIFANNLSVRITFKMSNPMQ